MSVEPSHSSPVAFAPRVVQQSLEESTALEGALLLASQCRIMMSLYATVAHDFRNSLNAMSLSMELLNRTLESGPDEQPDASLQRRYVDSVRQELRVMTQSVAQVLDESHFDLGSSSRCRVTEILESVVSLLRGRADRQRVQMTFDAPRDMIEVVGRSGELRLAVLNLAVNALDAMPRGGQLALRLTTENGFAAISVSDTGPGIPEAMRSLVWDLAFSTKGQGPGVGLHVVRNVTHQHGGAVTIDPSDSGACFTIRLPLRI